jgi:hypothetical protein
VPGLYQAIGGAVFAVVLIAAWILGARAIKSGAEGEQRLAIAGVFLIVPFALVLLLWVGLGPPWVATPPENLMRYLVLLVSSIAVSGGFVVLKDALSEGGERRYSTLGFAAMMLAGPAYLTFMSFALGAYVVKVRAGPGPPATVSLGTCGHPALSRAADVSRDHSVRGILRTNPLAWRGTGAYVAEPHRVALLVMRGMSFPGPGGSSTPWYTQPVSSRDPKRSQPRMPFRLGVVYCNVRAISNRDEGGLTKIAAPVSSTHLCRLQLLFPHRRSLCPYVRKPGATRR